MLLSKANCRKPPMNCFSISLGSLLLGWAQSFLPPPDGSLSSGIDGEETARNSQRAAPDNTTSYTRPETAVYEIMNPKTCPNSKGASTSSNFLHPKSEEIPSPTPPQLHGVIRSLKYTLPMCLLVYAKSSFSQVAPVSRLPPSQFDLR